MTKIYNIRPKDIQALTNKSYPQAYRDICKIRTYFGKKKHQIVTIDEAAEYTGLQPELIRSILIK